MKDVPATAHDADDGSCGRPGVSFNSPPVSSYLDDSGVHADDDVMDVGDDDDDDDDVGHTACRSSSEPVTFRSGYIFISLLAY